MTTSPIDPRVIEGWLRDMGADPRRTDEPLANWRFDLEYPPGMRRVMAVLNPKSKPRSVLVIIEFAVVQQYRVKFDALADEAKCKFHIDLQLTLNRPDVDYLIRDLNATWRSCPTGFQVTSTIFDDGLSLNSLAQRMSAACNAQVAGFFCIERALGSVDAIGTEMAGDPPTGMQ